MKNINNKLIIKKDSLLFYSYVIIMWIFFAFNYLNADYKNYESLYNIIASGIKDMGIEKGFSLLISIVQMVTLEFKYFHVVLATIFMIFIVMFINKFAEQRLFVLVLYSVFPFILETIQVRSALADCVMLYAFMVLLKVEEREKLKKNSIIYVIVVLIASQFHTSAIAYTLFMLILFNEKVLEVIVGFGLGIELMALFFRNQLILLIGYIFPKGGVYISNGLWNTKLGTKILFFIVVVGIPFVLKKLIYSEYYPQSRLIYKICLISALYYILFCIDVDFFRLYRNCFLYIYIGVSNCLHNMKNNIVKYLCYIILMICVFLINYAFIAFDSQNIYNIVHYNTLWK